MRQKTAVICLDLAHMNLIRRQALLAKRNCKQQLNWMLEHYQSLLQVLQVPTIRSAIIRAKREDVLYMGQAHSQSETQYEVPGGLQDIPGVRRTGSAGDPAGDSL